MFESPGQPDQRPRVLCVDDEPSVLEALRRQLHRDFDVIGYSEGSEALRRLSEDGSFQVIVSDMRMPFMDGSTLLGKARIIQPDTTRILLSGQSDLTDAARVVNEGGIFRFLLKPCPREMLEAALFDAVEYHERLTAERVLLEQTLKGSVDALLNTLALANPAAFARANRIRRLVSEILVLAEMPHGWKTEIAAALFQLGSVVVPPATLERLHSGAPLSPAEQAQLEELPGIAARLIANIPRLDDVRHIITRQAVPFARIGGLPPSDITKSAAVLRLAADLDYLQAGGYSRREALGILAARRGTYDPDLLGKLAADASGKPTPDEIRSIELYRLAPGMILAADVKDVSGRLLVGKGHEANESLIELLRNRSDTCSVVEPIHVIVTANSQPTPCSQEPVTQTAS